MFNVSHLLLHTVFTFQYHKGCLKHPKAKQNCKVGEIMLAIYENKGRAVEVKRCTIKMSH